MSAESLDQYLAIGHHIPMTDLNAGEKTDSWWSYSRRNPFAAKLEFPDQRSWPISRDLILGCLAGSHSGLENVRFTPTTDPEGNGTVTLTLVNDEALYVYGLGYEGLRTFYKGMCTVVPRGSESEFIAPAVDSAISQFQQLYQEYRGS